MPIAFSCPNCGKSMTVADQYAGQTGPCSACGKTMTIPGGSANPFGAATMPGPSSGPIAPPAKSSGGTVAILLVVFGVLGVIGLGCAGILVALLLPAIGAARSAAQRTQSMNNLKQMTLGLHNYADVWGSFPPAVVVDATGKPLYSGRVLLLPYLEQNPMFEQFDKSKAWDDPANIHLSQTMLKVFKDPANPDQSSPSTDYFFVVGSNAAFPDDGTTLSFSDITDGTSNTIGFMAASKSNQSWAEPVEITQAELGNGLPQSYHRNGTLAGTMDGAVHTLSPATSPSDLQSYSTRNGGETVFMY